MSAEQFHQKLVEIDDVRGELRDLSRAFRRTSNSKLANEISFYAVRLESAVEDLRKIYQDELNTSLKAVKGITAGMLAAVINGNIVGRPES